MKFKVYFLKNVPISNDEETGYAGTIQVEGFLALNETLKDLLTSRNTVGFPTVEVTVRSMLDALVSYDWDDELNEVVGIEVAVARYKTRTYEDMRKRLKH